MHTIRSQPDDDIGTERLIIIEMLYACCTFIIII